MDMNAATHEAGHATVLCSVMLKTSTGWVCGSDTLKEITIIPEGNNLGHVRRWCGSEIECTPEILAYLLAGAIAERRFGGSITGNSGDVEQIAKLLGHNVSDYRSVPASIRVIVDALQSAESTDEAIRLMPAGNALTAVSDPSFKLLAESADLARLILTTHWHVVLQLATGLLKHRRFFLIDYYMRKVGVRPVAWDAKSIRRRAQARARRAKARAKAKGATA